MMKTQFIISDLEYTSWEDAKANDWDKPGQFREMIRIGAIKVDWDIKARQGIPVEEFDVWTKPVIYPKISQYTLDLLKTTQEELDEKSVSIAEGLNRFVDFCDLNNGDKLVFSYGDDMGVKQENIGLYNYVAVMQKFMDNKSILTSEAKHIREITADSRMNGVNMCYYLRKADPTMRTVGCGGLWKHFNEPEPVRLDKMKAEAHDPVYDCHSLLAAINHLSRKGHYMPII